MFGEAFEGVFKLLYILAGICVISVPLGIWKLVEIIIWLVKNVSVSVG